jgi:hypothetical protein
MPIIKNFKNFNLINEMTEFNLQRFNPENASYPLPNVTNKQLSTDAFDKHQSAIQSALSRLNNIVGSLSNSHTLSTLKGKLALEEQNIQSMKILRILGSNSVNWNVYVSFVIDEYEYWGVIKNILDRNPDFKSEVFKDFDLIQSKDWIIKTKGLIVKAVRKWLEPEPGYYTQLNDEVIGTHMNTGRLLRIEKGAEVEVVRTTDNRILIKFKDDYFYLSGKNFIYFNWWFIKKED